MNDEPDLDLWLRASAYLDGELDAVERARAEADPEVMAEVELMRMLQDELRQVDPPTGAARSSAISAALREYDSIYEPASTAANVRPLRSTRSWGTMLTAVAAAVLIVAALGFVASRGLGGSDDDQDAGGDFAAADFATEEASATARAAGADQQVVSAEAAEPPAEEADVMYDAPTEGGALAPEATDAASATYAPAATMATDDQFAFDADQPVVGEHELALAGAALSEQQRTGQLANTPETRCGTVDESRPLEVLSTAEYIDDAGTITPVLIAVDPATGETLALDPDTCEPIATAPAP